MLTVVPKRWFSWDFDVEDDNRMPVGEVRLSAWRERGAVSAEGFENTVSRESALGAFVLERSGQVLARAEKPSAFRRTFAIEYDGKTYMLKALSAFGRAFVLYHDDLAIGTLAPTGFWTRRARVELPEDMPLTLKLFVIWLTLLHWKREADASHA